MSTTTITPQTTSNGEMQQTIYDVFQNGNIESLTTLETFYVSFMRSNIGVPFIKGRPGMGKTAIIESIANKMGMQYIDLRLPLLDDSEVGLMPIID